MASDIWRNASCVMRNAWCDFFAQGSAGNSLLSLDRERKGEGERWLEPPPASLAILHPFCKQSDPASAAIVRFTALDLARAGIILCLGWRPNPRPRLSSTWSSASSATCLRATTYRQTWKSTLQASTTSPSLAENSLISFRGGALDGSEVADTMTPWLGATSN